MKRVVITEGSLLPLFKPALEMGQRYRDVEGLPPYPEHSVRLVRSMCESVMVADKQRVAQAWTPIDAWPPEFKADCFAPDPGDDFPDFEPIIMKIHLLGTQGTDRSDESFVRSCADRLRALMRDDHGKPFVGFYIYSIVIGPTYAMGTDHGLNQWRIRCGGTKNVVP